MKEKEYTFFNHNPPLPVEEVKLKESELTIMHKNLLVGQIIKGFNDLPKECQIKFLDLILKDIEYAQKEQLIKQNIDATI